MNQLENTEAFEIVQAEAADPARRGIFRDAAGQLWFDRRYTLAVILAAGPYLPRSSDLNAPGQKYLPVSEQQAAQLGYNGA